ncbi:CvfB family protein [Aurantibacillus circumpalustris]|uniref:CvfB family protein n=1 Tax=Aurantibacillus circumpalustris TaxID=3036359 RepID=UPI00295C1A3E|nr:S1-like domain-containing RNA-binding protein [Aurantibacillus circumpalustris]
MIEIGKINTLTVLRETAVGFYLGDTEGGEVLLPNSYIKEKPSVKEKIEVFIYKDSEDRLIATLRKPIVKLNDFACLRVNAASDIGAFLDWGLEKELFVPFSEQKFNMEEGRYYVVRVFLDDVSKRIVGSSKLEKFLSNEEMKLEGGQEVEIMITEESPLGYSCIINGMHKGLIYHNDVYQDLFVGDEQIAYVKLIREDKLVDISLQKGGFKNVLSATEIILEYLENNDGFLNLHDKSNPEEISEKFAMSKATFKKSIGVLYRHRKVLIKPDGVYLVVNKEGTEEQSEEQTQEGE